mgnify:CR=1 FL=1
MRNYSKTVGALAAASTLVAGYASAEIEGEVHVGYHEMYEFRFVDLGSDLIEAGADISADFGAFGVSAGAWYGSYDRPVFGALVGSNLRSNYDELDLYAGVNYSIGDLTLELGYIYYYFPDSSTFFGLVLNPPVGLAANTQEIYLSAEYALPWNLTAETTLFWDFDAFDGFYWDTNLSYSYEINECLSIDCTVGGAYADGHGLQVSSNPGSVGTKDGFQGFYASVSVPWEFRENVTIAPYVKYTNSRSGLATDWWGTNSQDFLLSGVTLSVGF